MKNQTLMVLGVVCIYSLTIYCSISYWDSTQKQQENEERANDGSFISPYCIPVTFVDKFVMLYHRLVSSAMLNATSGSDDRFWWILLKFEHRQFDIRQLPVAMAGDTRRSVYVDSSYHQCVLGITR